MSEKTVAVGARIVKRPATNGNVDAECGIVFLECCQALVKWNILRCRGKDFKCLRIDSSKGKVDDRVDATRNLLREEGVARPSCTPSFVVANHPVEGAVFIASLSFDLLVATLKVC